MKDPKCSAIEYYLQAIKYFRYHYWLLYRLPEFPDSEAPPGNQLIAPVGKTI